MALKMVKGSIDRMFDKNLQDLVRGIRNHKEDEAKFISACIDEIKHELKQDNIAVKANAVCKLTYLQMLGYDVSWAAFNIIEVMSSSKFTFKRIGYLAASQCFHEGTDVIMLTTNQIRKDLSSPNQYDTGVALTGLSCFVTPDLARDLANDIMTLMSHTKPYIRKKAVLIMYKVFLKYPESLRPAFPRLKEKLEDPDPGVQSAAVNVICELARRNPKNYLSLAPLFFKLMTSSTNNWVLIKIIKLFGALTPLEPRLGKKLIEPLTNLIHSIYISILVELTRLEGTRHGHLIASQMLDVAIRVKAIRSFAVSQMAMLLDNAHLLAGNTQRNGICEVLYAAAWICGEFSEHLEEPMQTLEAMLRPKVTTLPGHIQAVYVQNAVKLFATVLARQEGAGDRQAAQETTELLIEKLPQFVQSSDLEVQERASCILQLIKYIQKLQAKEVSVSEEVSALFSGELNPVAPKAQKKVPIPDGLDLDSWINKPVRESESEDEKPRAIFHEEVPQHSRPRLPEIDEKELAKRREVRKQEQASNPFYIKSSPSPQKVKPLVDSDKLPVRTHRPTEGLKSPDPVAGVEEQDEKSSSKKIKKDKEKKDKERKKSKEEKKKKKHRKSASGKEVEEEGQVEKPAPPAAESESTAPPAAPPTEKPGLIPCTVQPSFLVCDPSADLTAPPLPASLWPEMPSCLISPPSLVLQDSDLDFWLSSAPVPSQSQPELVDPAPSSEPEEPKDEEEREESTEDGSSHEKLDFKLLFTCTSYLITTPCYSDAFAKLLESGELKMNSLKLEGITMPFHHLLAKICFHHHFSVVERIDSCSSMYSRSIQGHHVCLLVKTGDKSVSIDAKCDESTLLSNVLDEIKLTFAGTC
ncbi:UNVERIFIED_CONTAM: hypothetical protein FKN15_069924 [Acipenser sinensis]